MSRTQNPRADDDERPDCRRRRWHPPGAARALAKPMGVMLRRPAPASNCSTWWRRARTDIVILDMRLPLMDGLEVVEAMRGSEQFGQTPIVVLLSRTRDAEGHLTTDSPGCQRRCSETTAHGSFVARFRRTLVSKSHGVAHEVKPTHGLPELSPGCCPCCWSTRRCRCRALFEKNSTAG